MANTMIAPIGVCFAMEEALLSGPLVANMYAEIDEAARIEDSILGLIADFPSIRTYGRQTTHANARKAAKRAAVKVKRKATAKAIAKATAKAASLAAAYAEAEAAADARIIAEEAAALATRAAEKAAAEQKAMADQTAFEQWLAEQESTHPTEWDQTDYICSRCKCDVHDCPESGDHGDADRDIMRMLLRKRGRRRSI